MFEIILKAKAERIHLSSTRIQFIQFDSKLLRVYTLKLKVISYHCPMYFRLPIPITYAHV